jgi:hypothetical protein
MYRCRVCFVREKNHGLVGRSSWAQLAKPLQAELCQLALGCDASARSVHSQLCTDAQRMLFCQVHLETAVG